MMSNYELTQAIEKAQRFYRYAKGRERALWFSHLQILVKVRELRLIHQANNSGGKS